jgi:tRNA modification GTPase
MAELDLLLQRTRALTSAPVVAAQTKVDLWPTSATERPTAALPVSALTGEGLELLTQRIASLLTDQFGAAVSEAPLLTRQRHRDAVKAARGELRAFAAAWAANDPPSSVAAIHLREAAHHLGELIGSIDVDDVLDRVFSGFCVGK